MRDDALLLAGALALCLAVVAAVEVRFAGGTAAVVASSERAVAEGTPTPVGDLPPPARWYVRGAVEGDLEERCLTLVAFGHAVSPKVTLVRGLRPTPGVGLPFWVPVAVDDVGFVPSWPVRYEGTTYGAYFYGSGAETPLPGYVLAGAFGAVGVGSLVRWRTARSDPRTSAD